MTNTRCCIGIVISPDDGHIVAQNKYRKAINILRKIVHEVGSIYKTTSPYNSHKHLRICTQPKSKLLGLLHSPMQHTVLGSSTSQEISCIHYSVHTTPITTTVLSRMNLIHHTFPPYFLKIHFNPILSNMSSSSK